MAAAAVVQKAAAKAAAALVFVSKKEVLIESLQHQLENATAADKREIKHKINVAKSSITETRKRKIAAAGVRKRKESKKRYVKKSSKKLRTANVAGKYCFL